MGEETLEDPRIRHETHLAAKVGLKLRNHKITQQNGFESEKRKSERHQSFRQLEKYAQQAA